MALEKCGECGQPVSTKATACPACGAPVKRGGIGCGGAFAVGVALLLVVMWFAAQDHQDYKARTPGSVESPAPPSPTANQRYIHTTVNVRAGPGERHEVVRQLLRGDWVIVRETQNGWARVTDKEWVAERLLHDHAVPSDEELRLQGLKWNYASSDDQMGGGKIRQAWVNSVNSFEFDFPYTGAQRATLRLREHPRFGKDVILSIERGQFLCHCGCLVCVRFGDHPKTYDASGPADHSTTTLFIDGYRDFVSRMRQTTRVAIEVSVYQEGARVFEFDVAGLEWPPRRGTP